ncbi:putative ATP-dependent RNA helicase Dbp73D [Papilio xuthus]|uniref:ATP-dependent RNA helicase n=1 Tax=Papilio xuthus TaxID=66420 RepID=A0A194PMW9_PAPXU|nr:putative ATP-dependent RNA helicase Dbp73D [Papilio xuthus]
MDLFIINRYNGENVDEDIIDRETKHLQRLKQKIEERKKSHETQKVLDVITLKQDEEKVLNIENQVHVEESVTVDLKEDANYDLPDEKKSEKRKKDTNEKGIEFKVLGLNDFEKKSKVQRVLPHWLSHPYSVSKNLQNLNCKVEDQTWLHSILKTTLLNEGVTHLFPVQEQVIPFILNEHKLPYPLWPHDICVSAPTGSGKTLTFVLPIIQVLMNQLGHYIRALIVLPVQELAVQVFKVCKKYCTNTGLRTALLTGSTPLQQEQQQLMKYTESLGWISEVDIIVCTAGRLVEHLQNTDGFSLKHLKFLVIDEADRIMDNIQNDWLYHMDRHIRHENELTSNKVPHLNWNSISDQKSLPHKLLFSATLTPDPELLEQWGLFQPKLFSVAPISDFDGGSLIKKYTTPDELIENYVVCNAEEKPLILFHLLVEKKWDKVLCFTNSAQSVHRLAVLLNEWGKDQCLKVAELSSALDRASREKVLEKFKQSEVNVIISTDALARGIDIPDCNYVVSYDPPRNIKTYVHRVGRTGRAGRIGRAVTILNHNQLNMFKEQIQSSGKSEINQLEVSEESYSHLLQSYESAIQETKQIIHTEINNKVKKSIELKRGMKKKTRKRKHNE